MGAEWERLMAQLRDSLAHSEATRDFARRLGDGRGVSGYAYHTVPAALHAWLTHPGDFQAALSGALDCGGDADTVGAMTGALVLAWRSPQKSLLPRLRVVAWSAATRTPILIRIQPEQPCARPLS